MIANLQSYSNFDVSFCQNFKIDNEQKVDFSKALKGVEAGFSLIELLIVILILMIMAAVAIFPFIAHRNAYRTEDQALRLINLLEHAKMRALAAQRTVRFEIDLTNRVLRVVDEMGTISDSSDDVVLKQEEFIDEVRFDRQPINLTGILPNVSITATPLYYNPIAYNANNVWVSRFLSDGKATIPDNCLETNCSCNVTIFMWRQAQNNPNDADPVQAVRAITIFGGTSNVRLWQHDGTNFQEW